MSTDQGTDTDEEDADAHMTTNPSTDTSDGDEGMEGDQTPDKDQQTDGAVAPAQVTDGDEEDGTETDGGEENPDEGDDPDESVDQGAEAEGANIEVGRAEGAGGTDSTDPQPDAGSAIEGSNPMPQPQPNTPGSVTLTGTATEDETLTATVTDTDGLPDDAANIRYQWQRSDGNGGFANISNATSPTYTLGDADVGRNIRVVVNYTDANNTPESLTSDATAAVSNINDSPSGSVSIDGTAEEDQILTANVDNVADADGLGAFSYQWQRSNGSGGFEDIANATGETYSLGDADVGRNIRFVVSYTDDGGMDESLTAAATALAENVNDEPTGSVTIDGTVREDQTLTAETTALQDADGLPADAAGYRYQWQRNTDSSFENIAGETGNTYTLDDADVGREVRVQVSYTDDGGMDDSLSSAPTAVVENVNDEPTGSVSIDGTVEEDQTLTANTDNLEIALSATETLTLEGVNRDVLTAETVTTLDEEGNDTTTPLADVNSDSDAPAFELDNLAMDEEAMMRLADWEAVNLLAPVEPQVPPSAGEDSLSAGSANRALPLADPLEPPPTLALFDADLEGYSAV